LPFLIFIPAFTQKTVKQSRSSVLGMARQTDRSVDLCGHGGGKCAEALRTVCAGGLKMTLLPPELDVKVTLPHDHIQGDVRVVAARFNDGPAASAAQPAAGGSESSDAQPYFLAQYDIALDAMLTELLTAMERSPPPPEARKTDRA
jgi:hypothetical protein